MEIIFLFCLYYLSQHPDFPETMKPLLGTLKNSEEMLKFMNELSHFSEMFSLFTPKKANNEQTSSTQTQTQNTNAASEKTTTSTTTNEKGQEKNSPTATEGIADEFIERCLQNYFKNR